MAHSTFFYIVCVYSPPLEQLRGYQYTLYCFSIQIFGAFGNILLKRTRCSFLLSDPFIAVIVDCRIDIDNNITIFFSKIFPFIKVYPLPIQVGLYSVLFQID